MLFNRECKRISPLLWDYVGDRLQTPERNRAEIHLRKCGACREQARRYEQTALTVQAYRATAVPESRATWLELRTKLAAEQSGTFRPVVAPRRGHSLMLAGALAAGVFVAIVVWTVRPDSVAPPPQPTGDGMRVAQDSQLDPTKPVTGPAAKTTTGPTKTHTAAANPAAHPRCSGGGSSASSSEARHHPRPAHHEDVGPRPTRTNLHPYVQYATLPGFAADRPLEVRPNRDFVITPAVMSNGPQRDYVMDGISESGQRISSASGAEAGERPVW